MKNLLSKSIVLMNIVLLTSCATTHSIQHWLRPEKPPQTHIAYPNKSAEQTLQLAATSPSPQQEYYLLLAVDKLIQQNKLTRAEQVLASINTYHLPKDILIKKQLLYAKTLLAKQEPKRALHALNKVAISDSMNKKDQRELHQALALSYEKTHNIVASIQQRNLLEPLLPTQHEKTDNQLTIWESVQHLPNSDINSLLTQPLSPDIRGWLELAQLAQQSPQHTNTLIQQLNQWKNTYPTHSGNNLLSQKTHHNPRLIAKPPQQIYLLLPLHGKFSASGRAVRNGFMAAYYNSKQQNDTHSAIHVLDTTRGNIIDNYRDAVNNGADFIIGPLTKSSIQQLVQNSTLTVPTLTLNYIPSLHAENLYQFGLSQFDEAEQIAKQARKAGLHRAILIAPKAPWGQTIANHFKDIWQENGGEIVDTLAYNNSNDLSKPIRDLLEVNQSESRAKVLQSVLHEELRFVPNRRTDVDMIFLVALPQQGRSIRPMLTFYWAGDLPVYATSLIYDPSLSAQQNKDIDHITFPDMPWVLGNLTPPLHAVQDKAQSLWTASYNANKKFYALGVDAYQLTNTLPKLLIFPHYALQGATGTLFLNHDQHVYRALTWAKMEDGQPHRINTPT